jgi:hypothetical protein
MRATGWAVGARCRPVKTRNREIGCRCKTRKKVAIVGRGEDVHFVYDLARVSFEQRTDYARQMMLSTGSVPICGDRSWVLFSPQATITF